MQRQRLKAINRLLIDAKEKENRDKAWDMWLQRYQQMNKDNFIDFESFYKKLTTTNIPVPEEPPKNRIQKLFNKLKPKVMQND